LLSARNLEQIGAVSSDCSQPGWLHQGLKQGLKQMRQALRLGGDQGLVRGFIGLWHG